MFGPSESSQMPVLNPFPNFGSARRGSAVLEHPTFQNNVQHAVEQGALEHCTIQIKYNMRENSERCQLLEPGHSLRTFDIASLLM